jgi:Tfp pilus assembly PilM family ATPase
MLGLLKKHAYPIGIDIEDDSLKLVQLGRNGKGATLIAGNNRNRPEDVKPGSTDWQRWAIENIHLLTEYGNFQGKEVVAAMPTSEVFIDYVKMPKTDGGKLDEAVFSKIKQKLPFEALPQNTMMKCIPTEEDNVLVMATERKIIDRHLAIYEKAGLAIKSIGAWPTALTNCYARFFGRRKPDLEAVVMLTCIEANCTNVVICRHKNLLFARSVSIGVKQLDDEKVVTRLALELSACRRHFSSMYRKAQIERLIFLSGQAVDRQICATIAKQLEVPAQVADCLAAVEIADSCRLGRNPERDKGRSDVPIDRRGCACPETRPQNQEQVNWAIAFGLSLS